MTEFMLRIDRGWRALWRLLTMHRCDLCGSRTRCWRWHVEVFDCPTCDRPVSEFDPAFGRVLNVVTAPPTSPWQWSATTTGGTVNVTYRSLP